MKFVNCVAACLLLVANAQAATVVIDFEDVAVGTVDPVSSRGFDFFTLLGSEVVTGNALALNSFTRSDGLSLSYLNFSQQALEPFDLKSFVIQIDWPISVVNLTVTGNYVGGGSVQQGFSVDSFNASQLTFGAVWTNLRTATIEIVDYTYSAPGTIYVDNITVSTVPVPAAVWLFASSLGLLGWLQRRRNLSH